jgi:uncharacterized protein YcbX
MILGTLTEIWRYPVKSMGGERVQAAFVKPRGVAGDRCWTVIDSERKEIANAKRWPELLNFRASLCAGDDLVESGYDEEVPEVELESPQGDVFRARDGDAGHRLSTQLERPVQLSPLVRPGNTDHYRTTVHRERETVIDEMGLVPGAFLSGTSAVPESLKVEIGQFITPPGTYVDAYPVHMMTTNSLDYLSEKGDVDAVVQRFRPNLLIEPAVRLPELTENAWVDRRVQLGEAILHIHSCTVRCSMPGRSQVWCGLTERENMSHIMLDVCDRHLGVNVMIEKGGRISIGDALILLDT